MMDSFEPFVAPPKPTLVGKESSKYLAPGIASLVTMILSVMIFTLLLLSPIFWADWFKGESSETVIGILLFFMIVPLLLSSIITGVIGIKTTQGKIGLAFSSVFTALFITILVVYAK